MFSDLDDDDEEQEPQEKIRINQGENISENYSNEEDSSAQKMKRRRSGMSYVTESTDL